MQVRATNSNVTILGNPNGRFEFTAAAVVKIKGHQDIYILCDSHGYTISDIANYPERWSKNGKTVYFLDVDKALKHLESIEK